MFGVDDFRAMETGAVLRRLEDTLPGAGHVAVLHGEGPEPGRLTGRDGKVRGVAAFGVLYKVGFVQHLHLFEVAAPGGCLLYTSRCV